MTDKKAETTLQAMMHWRETKYFRDFVQYPNWKFLACS